MARVNCNPLLSTAGVVVCSVFSHAAAAADTAPAPTELPEISVIATTPVGTTSISEDKYPGNVQIINHKDMPPNAHSLPDVLDQTVGSVTVNNTQGNPFVVDLNYRGFTASPVLGNPANNGRAVPLSYEQFRYAFANAVSESEAHELYNTYAVPAAGKAFTGWTGACSGLDPNACVVTLNGDTKVQAGFSR